MGNTIRANALKQSGIPATVDMNRLFQHESNFVSDAQGARGDMGLGQITPIALADWNNQHPNEKYQHIPEHMFNPSINSKVSNWLVNQRAPQLLNHYGVADTLENRLAVYNGGIGTLVKHGIIPQVQKYIDGYKSVKVTGQPVGIGQAVLQSGGQ